MKLKEITFESPVLELGCGDGAFGSLIFDSIDDAIDINLRAVQRCLQKRKDTYKRVHCMDARSLTFGENSYLTVFANCVIEHMPDLRKVLISCYRVLKPGGKFVATVPLKEMNNHLLMSSAWYIKMRQRQLAHVNLFTEDEWRKELELAGFRSVECIPYLSSRTCHYWDLLDSPICLGYKRYTISALLRKAGHIFPGAIKRWAYEKMADYLCSLVDASVEKDPCATIIIAHK